MAVSDIDVESILSAYSDTLAEQISPEAIREATEFGTVPTGTYRAEVVKKEWRDVYKEFDGVTKPKRLRLALHVKLTDPQTGKRAGMVFPEISPIVGRYENGNQDLLSRLWNQIAGVHDAAKRGLQAIKLADEIGNYPFTVKVNEQFIDMTVPFGTEGKFKVAKSPEEAQQYRDAGRKARNTVESFKAA